MNFETPQVQNTSETVESPITIEQNTYRGVFSETLKDGERLPVGGSMFGGPMNIFLTLDFETFKEDVKGFTSDNLQKIYESQKEIFDEWFEKLNFKGINSKDFFILFTIQKTIQRILKTENNQENVDKKSRRELYANPGAKLSDFVSVTECAERAAFAQYILQNSGIKSAYMSGIVINDAGDMNEYPEDHSFIILNLGDEDNEKQYVFDVARPYSEHNIPHLFEIKNKINKDTFKDTDDKLILSQSVIDGRQLYFGVGDVVLGTRNVSN